MPDLQRDWESGEKVSRLPDISRTDIETLMREWMIGPNAQRDRAILSRRLFDGITFEKLAEEFDLSVRHTKQIVYDAERKIFRHIPG